MFNSVYFVESGLFLTPDSVDFVEFHKIDRVAFDNVASVYGPKANVT